MFFGYSGVNPQGKSTGLVPLRVLEPETLVVILPPEPAPVEEGWNYGPFIFPPNITLTFNVPAGEFGVDGDGTQEVRAAKMCVVASVAEVRNNRGYDTREQATDADIFQKRVKGRVCGDFVNQLHLLMPGAKASATVWRLDSGFTLPTRFRSVEDLDRFKVINKQHIRGEGVFSLAFDVGSRWGIQEVLGDRLVGLITSEVAWSDI